MGVNGNRGRVFAILREAAETGGQCPTNAEIQLAAGYRYKNAVSTAIYEMAQAGHFKVRRLGHSREIVFPDGLTIATGEIWSELRDEVGAAFGVPPFNLVAAGRKRATVRARIAVAYVLRRKFAGISLPQIGRILGGRDHSSIIYYLERASWFHERDEDFRGKVEALVKCEALPRPHFTVVPKPKPKAVDEAVYERAETSWCDQCQSRVAVDRAVACASRWCSLKAIA